MNNILNADPLNQVLSEQAALNVLQAQINVTTAQHIKDITGKYQDVSARIQELEKLLKGQVIPAVKYRVLSKDMEFFKLTTHRPDSKGKPIEIFMPQLLSYNSDTFNYDPKAKIVKVACPYFGPKTSSKTRSTRNERRGQGENEFTHDECVEFASKYSLDEVDDDRKVVTQQFHDNNAPMYKRTSLHVRGDIYEVYQLVKMSEDSDVDTKIVMGTYKLGEVIDAVARYDGMNKVISFQDNGGKVHTLEGLKYTGKYGKFYPKDFIYPMYKDGDENYPNKLCRATFYL